VAAKVAFRGECGGVVFWEGLQVAGLQVAGSGLRHLLTNLKGDTYYKI